MQFSTRSNDSGIPFDCMYTKFLYHSLLFLRVSFPYQSKDSLSYPSYYSLEYFLADLQLEPGARGQEEEAPQVRGRYRQALPVPGRPLPQELRLGGVARAAHQAQTPQLLQHDLLEHSADAEQVEERRKLQKQRRQLFLAAAPAAAAAAATVAVALPEL